MLIHLVGWSFFVGRTLVHQPPREPVKMEGNLIRNWARKHSHGGNNEILTANAELLRREFHPVVHTFRCSNNIPRVARPTNVAALTNLLRWKINYLTRFDRARAYMYVIFLVTASNSSDVSSRVVWNGGPSLTTLAFIRALRRTWLSIRFKGIPMSCQPAG